MGNRRGKEKRRNLLLRKVATLREALPGNLTSTQAWSKPRGRSASAPYGPVWRLTWKEEQKTKTFYVRQAEVQTVRRGVEQMRQIKGVVRDVGEINLELLIAERDKR